MQQLQGGMGTIVMLVVFGLIFYFMAIRPQNKRQKEQAKMLAELTKGDEVLTNGGIIGKITKVSADNDYLVLELADNVEITIKRNFIVSPVPKGTLKSL